MEPNEEDFFVIPRMGETPENAGAEASIRATYGSLLFRSMAAAELNSITNLPDGFARGIWPKRTWRYRLRSWWFWHRPHLSLGPPKSDDW